MRLRVPHDPQASVCTVPGVQTPCPVHVDQFPKSHELEQVRVCVPHNPHSWVC